MIITPAKKITLANGMDNYQLQTNVSITHANELDKDHTYQLRPVLWKQMADLFT